MCQRMSSFIKMSSWVGCFHMNWHWPGWLVFGDQSETHCDFFFILLCASLAMDVVDVTVSHGQGKGQNFLFSLFFFFLWFAWRKTTAIARSQLVRHTQWLFLLFVSSLNVLPSVCVFNRNLSQRVTQLNWKQMAGNSKRQKVSPLCHVGDFLFSTLNHQKRLKIQKTKIPVDWSEE